MGKFKPARFGNAAVNIVTGELQIEGATVINSITVIDTINIPADISLILIDIPSSKTLTLPNIADVPVGHTISFKDSTGSLSHLSIQCTIEGDAVVDAGTGFLPGTDGIKLISGWSGVTLCSDGTIWNITNYFDGST